ncbi:hypothetical protein SCLCIDRAFT_1216435, partial [Scleroderma citrinum Foug A]
MSCDLETGNYNVLSYRDGNSVNTCPSVAPAEVVVLTDVTPVRVMRVQGPPDCTYNIYVSDGHVKPVEENLLQAAITRDMPREWIITHHPGLGAYTVVLRDEPILAWTDLENAPGCDRRLRLTPLNGSVPPQLFRFVRVA